MKRFRYPLDAILKQFDWEIDALKVEMMTLNQVLRVRQEELNEVQQVVNETERQIMAMCQENAVISIDRKTLLERYLRAQRANMLVKQQEVEHTQNLVDGVFSQLSKKKQEQRAIEKHRERKKKDHVSEAARVESLEADELWLSKIAGSQ